MQRPTHPFRALRAGWWLLPVVLVAAVGGAAWFDNTGEEATLYRSNVTLAAVPDSSVTNPNQRLRSVEILERRSMVSTLSRLPRSGPLRRRAARRLGVSPGDMGPYSVFTRVLPGTHLIGVTVRGPDADVASDFANALAEVSAEEAGEYYGVFTLRLLDDASVPGVPVGEGEGRRTYAVAGVLGLFLGMGAAYGVGRLRLA